MPYYDYDDHDHAEDKRNASIWAQKLLAGEFGDWCILDTETTGLYDPEIIDIAIISKYKSPFINTRVKPVGEIESGAIKVHGITKEQLEDAPTFSEIYERVREVTKDRLVIIYNANFDTNALFQTCKVNKLPRINFKSKCAMNKYAQWYGEYSSYWGNYKWQKLPGAKHTALDDCLATYDLLQKMAAHEEPSRQVVEHKLFPPFQIGCKWRNKYILDIRLDRVGSYWFKRWRVKVSLPKFYRLTDKDAQEVIYQNHFD